MTVVWETNLPIDAKIGYGVNGQWDNKIAVQCERGTPWKDNPEGICIYKAALENLQPDTVYDYQVELKSGEIQQGTFKTLCENPREIRIFTLSDSHLFNTNKEFAITVLQNKPEFIIHSGDISLGTGFQKDQYTTNWFDKGAEFLKKIPVIYTLGNHDDGPYCDDFFMNVQKQSYHTNENGHNISFNYGHTHITIVDSNPWGLFEMNAVNSGLPVDGATRSKIDSSLHWIMEDLQSSAAQKADWRILVLHHPYTDDFTQKYIVDIAEKYHVNLVISGHLHYYIKNVSVNPQIGAKTVYISQGSAEEHGAALDYGNEGERILPDFPEVVAQGMANYGCIIINEDKLVFKTYGCRNGQSVGQLVDEVMLVKEEPRIVVSDIIIKTEDNSGTVVIQGIAKNEGEGLAVAVLKIVDNGQEVLQNLFGVHGKERVIALNPGELRNFIAQYYLSEPGRHILKVGKATKIINLSVQNQVCLDNMKITVGQGNVADVVFATVEATNYKDVQALTSVHLYIDDQIVDTQKVDLASYEKQVINFAYKFRQGGTYQVRIENLTCQEVSIEGTLKGIPIIKDLSGNENNGFLRGTPSVVADREKVSVTFDDYGDYIEIPDSGKLHIETGYTGMVWANVNRLATEEEMAHNPLMLKGTSLGWGATYLLRMAVERSGGLKWGTCHGITEYSWQGGKVDLGMWTQYTSTFDKQTGGASYRNGQKVAEIAGIKADAKLRNWEGLPLFVGYSYIGHVIKEIGRPKYFTHLPAQVSQVRFYKTKLSQEENQYIDEHPTEVGPRSEELLVWLNFKDIEKKGIHKTEWRRPAAFHPSYKAEKKFWDFKTLTTDTVITGGASLIANVQVSDDAETVKDCKKIVLQNGRQIIDLAGLKKAQYVRIVTDFNSETSAAGTDTPALNQYEIMASADHITIKFGWGTRVEWERGSMEGAVGFEPLNRLKIFDEYTDVIHG